MAIGTTFTVGIQFGDSAGPTFSGTTAISPANTGSNAIQINQEVLANTSVVATAEPHATTYDLPALNTPITIANITGMGFLCRLVNLNSNANTPVAYVKLKAAMSGANFDYVFPLIPNQSAQYLPIKATDANGNTMNTANTTIAGSVQFTNTTISSITVTPDKTSDLQILGTIEISL